MRPLSPRTCRRRHDAQPMDVSSLGCRGQVAANTHGGHECVHCEVITRRWHFAHRNHQGWTHVGCHVLHLITRHFRSETGHSKSDPIRLLLFDCCCSIVAATVAAATAAAPKTTHTKESREFAPPRSRSRARHSHRAPTTYPDAEAAASPHCTQQQAQAAAAPAADNNAGS